MNFLAHVYLSGDSKPIQVGNFIGDYVKGAAFTKYPDELRCGILLHRAIDDYTDNHPTVQEAKRLVQPHFGRYAGIFIDMYYDHYLAANFDRFSPIPLARFAWGFYWAMIRHYTYLPANVRGFLPHLIVSNRLYVYAKLEGIQRSLEIMETYSSLPKKSKEAVEVLTNNYDTLKSNFFDFFPQLKDFSKQKLEEIKHPYF